jgi:hypothetical protein
MSIELDRGQVHGSRFPFQAFPEATVPVFSHDIYNPDDSDRTAYTP